MLAPFVIGIVAFTCNLFMTCKVFSYIVEWMGQHSLDIYVGNIIICYVLTHTSFLSGNALYYLIGHLIIVPIVIFVCNNLNGIVKKRIKNF